MGPWNLNNKLNARTKDLKSWHDKVMASSNVAALGHSVAPISQWGNISS